MRRRSRTWTWWSPFDQARGHSLLDEVRLERHLTELLGAQVDLAFEPLHKAQFRARVEQEQVRAF
jgi:predicted nucleotidyltransferase